MQIYDILFGKERCPMLVTAFGKSQEPIRSYLEHSHQDWEIILHLAGHVTTFVDQTPYALSAGDIIVIPPGSVHSGNSDVLFSDIYIQVKDLDYTNCFVVHDEDGDVPLLMQMLYKVLTQKAEHYEALSDSLSDTIGQYIRKYTDTRPLSPIVARLRNILYENLEHAGFALTEAIESTGFNPDYLRRCFKRDTGQTPLAYLTGLRLNLAKNLLVQDNFISIADVAARCGFQDSFYFSTCFKKNTGRTPSEYRREQRRKRES